MATEDEPPHFRVLGTFEVTRGARRCTPSAPKQRALLALLALHANEFVPTSRIVDQLWSRDAPRSAVAALHGYVTAVRRVLTPGWGRSRASHPVLSTRPSGYVLRLEPHQLDLTRFRELSRQGQVAMAAGDCRTAREKFTTALCLWRGSPLADLNDTGMFDHDVTRLEKEYLELLRNRFDVMLCAGDGHLAVFDLEELCQTYPCWERFHEQLMLALCQAERRADALTAYARAYRLLSNQAGIEPGPRLKALHQLILNGEDPFDRAHRHERALSGLPPAGTGSP
ncbi:DNA-binding transcriptional activator of the SARP family [Lentzea fradiae]|uniref:DNA-binding transcriptional activator of the SARP family n=1 Tax=Lentzea fradiae TaxID=200378 RepID=A0A1G7L0V7_9PSEU|nr:AfsR/SARP family transcriptional regulator [Lentzea fradiae]SDF42639.1 DNA-binding transcriptional activator of the SARP family [Lentzea fradiae]